MSVAVEGTAAPVVTPVTTPAPATTPAAAPSKPVADPAKVAALLAGKNPPATEANPPVSTENPPATDTPPVEAAPEGDSKLAKRLAAIAAQEAKLRKGKEAAEAAEADAAKWRAFEAAKGKGERMTALKALFNEGELTTAVYEELTDLVIAAHKAPSDEEKIQALVDARLAKAEKDKADAATKAATEREASVKTGFTSHVAKTFEGSPDKWPLVNQFGVSASDIHGKVEAEFKRTGKVLAATAVLDLFEREHEARIEASSKYARKVEAALTEQVGAKETPKQSTTVTSSWTRDSGTPIPEGLSGKALLDSIKRKYLKP